MERGVSPQTAWPAPHRFIRFYKATHTTLRNCAKRTVPRDVPLPSSLAVGLSPARWSWSYCSEPAGLFTHGGLVVAESTVVISSRGVERLRSGHLWVYRSDIRTAPADAAPVVRLTDDRGRFHGRAFYSDKSQIAVRLLTRDETPVDRAFFTERIRRAAAYRLLVVRNTDAYRLVYGEADQLPSLIVDRYGDYLVMQTLSQATERHKSLFVEILVELFSPKGILERNDPKVRLLEGLDQRVGALHGKIPDEIVAKENGIAF